MNNLSIFLWLADVLPTLGGVLLFIGGFCTLLFVITSVFRYFSIVDPECREEIRDAIKYIWRSFLIFGPVLLLIGLLIPSKQTIYMIGASQAGEYIIQLEEVQELGGEVGGLAKDTIEMLRQNIQSVTPGITNESTSD